MKTRNFELETFTPIFTPDVVSDMLTTSQTLKPPRPHYDSLTQSSLQNRN
jgi:hypothetical protein